MLLETHTQGRVGPISGLKLEMEMVPKSTWGQSLANILPRPVWDTIRREVYSSSNYCCSACGDMSSRLNCHEVWDFNDKKRLQILAGFQCLCEDCHRIKHWGRTSLLISKGELPKRKEEELIKHFCQVNRCKKTTFTAHSRKVHSLWAGRSKVKYTVDFGKFEPSKLIQTWTNLRKEGKIK